MTLDQAVRATEVMMALAFLQQSAEHFVSERRERALFIPRFGLSLLLLSGLANGLALAGLMLIGLLMLRRFQGPYNGGSDRMSLLILTCLTLVHFLPAVHWKETAFGYLGFQLVLSYFISGWVKVVNPDWRSGRALCDVFRFSAYPVSEALRGWADWPRLMFVMSWGVMGFELAFPATLLHPALLIAGLVVAACFHFSNALCFGLNRFFWIWLCAYPSIIWLQQRLFTGA